MIWTWNLNPTLFSFAGLDVRWYGFMYLIGFGLAWYLLPKLLIHRQYEISRENLENLLFGIFFTGVLGGRVGEFLFYNPIIFWTNPIEILQIWHGGMSIHGGILFAAIFTWWWCRKYQYNFWKIADTIIVPLFLALAFGRLANFINGELVGIPTSQSWGVIFPLTDHLARHPSQLYEVAKNLLMFGFLWIAFWRWNWWKIQKLLLSLFLLGYGFLRFLIEFWKESDVSFLGINNSQWLCLIMIVIGFILLVEIFWLAEFISIKAKICKILQEIEREAKKDYILLRRFLRKLNKTTKKVKKISKKISKKIKKKINKKK